MARVSERYGSFEDVIPCTYRYKTVTLSQAQINSLFTAPVTILAANPNYHNIIDRAWLYRQPGTAYAGAIGNFLINNGATNWYQIAAATQLGAAGPKAVAILYPTFNSADVSGNLNSAWTAKLQSADPTPGTGSGELQIKFRYQSIFLGKR